MTDITSLLTWLFFWGTSNKARNTWPFNAPTIKVTNKHQLHGRPCDLVGMLLCDITCI